jgi:hypothetical protein
MFYNCAKTRLQAGKIYKLQGRKQAIYVCKLPT